MTTPPSTPFFSSLSPEAAANPSQQWVRAAQGKSRAVGSSKKSPFHWWGSCLSQYPEGQHTWLCQQTEPQSWRKLQKEDVIRKRFSSRELHDCQPALSAREDHGTGHQRTEQSWGRVWWGAAEGAGGAQPGEQEAQRGIFSLSYNSLKGGCNQVGVVLLSNKWQDTRKWPQVVPREV